MRKLRILLVLIILVIIIIIVKQQLSIDGTWNVNLQQSPSIKGHQDLVSDGRSPLSSLVVIIRDFEAFDNDVSGTCGSVVSACRGQCRVFVVSDEPIYPPLQLPPQAQVVVLQADLL